MTSPTIWLVAGEPSGDLLGGRLMAAIKARHPEGVRFGGVGGPAMIAEGLQSLFPMHDLSVMGVAEVLPRLPLLLRRIGETVAAVEAARPDLLITIDAPDFNFRVAKRLRAKLPDRPILHYVAPSVWAWRPGRAKKIAGFLDHLLALLPFEPPWFERAGLPCTYVGHAVIDAGLDKGDGIGWRETHNIPQDAPLLAMLPGSRRGEVARLLPVFKNTIRLIAHHVPGLHIVVPTVPHVQEMVADSLSDLPLPCQIEPDPAAKADVFAAADAALVASGTATLELAMAGCPMAIGYRLAPLTAIIGRQLVRTPHIGLPNLILGRRAFPEFLQERCTARRLAEAIPALLDRNSPIRRSQAEALAELKQQMGTDSPSARAAAVVDALLAKGRARAMAAGAAPSFAVPPVLTPEAPPAEPVQIAPPVMAVEVPVPAPVSMPVAAAPVPPPPASPRVEPVPEAKPTPPVAPAAEAKPVPEPAVPAPQSKPPTRAAPVLRVIENPPVQRPEPAPEPKPDPVVPVVEAKPSSQPDPVVVPQAEPPKPAPEPAPPPPAPQPPPAPPKPAPVAPPPVRAEPVQPAANAMPPQRMRTGGDDKESG